MERKNAEVPIWQKQNLTIKEAAAYSNIGENRLEGLLRDPRCPFALRVGTKRLIKRKQFDDFISKAEIL